MSQNIIEVDEQNIQDIYNELQEFIVLKHNERYDDDIQYSTIRNHFTKKEQKELLNSGWENIDFTFSISSPKQRFDTAEIFYFCIQKYSALRWIGETLDVVDFIKYDPTYASMNASQFTYYIYWRTKALNGEVINCPITYFYIYVYELLAGFHDISYSKIFDKLSDIYTKYRLFNLNADKYLPQWSFDFCLLHDLFSQKKETLKTFQKYQNQYNNIDLKSSRYIQVQQNQILNNEYKNCFAYVIGVSSYKIDKKSSFFTQQKDCGLIQLVFDTVMSNINKLMTFYGFSLSEYLVGQKTNKKVDIYNATRWKNRFDIIGNIQSKKDVVFNDITYIYNKKENVFYQNDSIEIYGKITGETELQKNNSKLTNPKFVGYIVMCIEQICREKLHYNETLIPKYISNADSPKLNTLIQSGLIKSIIDETITGLIEDVIKNLKSNIPKQVDIQIKPDDNIKDDFFATIKLHDSHLNNLIRNKAKRGLSISCNVPEDLETLIQALEHEVEILKLLLARLKYSGAITQMFKSFSNNNSSTNLHINRSLRLKPHEIPLKLPHCIDTTIKHNLPFSSQYKSFIIDNDIGLVQTKPISKYDMYGEDDEE